MSTITCLVLCAVAMKLIIVHAAGDENKPSTEDMKLVKGEECMKEFGLTVDDLANIKTADDVPKINPCFFDCYYTKLGFLDDQGEGDSDLARVKNNLRSFDAYVALEKIRAQCKIPEAKDKGVSGEQVVCERGAALQVCVFNEVALTQKISRE